MFTVAEPYEMWVWLVEEADGVEGPVAATIPSLGVIGPLQHRKKGMVERLGPLARQHGVASGRPVRLAHLVEAP